MPYAGRVEVLLAGTWGAIDRYTWELPDADVACRQLGFSAAELAVRGATYILSAKGSKAMGIQWIDNVHCLGSESLLYECSHNVSFTPGPVFEAGAVCKTNNSGTNLHQNIDNLFATNSTEVGKDKRQTNKTTEK